MKSSSQRALKIRIIGATLVVLFLAWEHIEATRLGYKVERARRQVQVLRERIVSINMDLETSVSPAQLALQAKNKLGMFPATPQCLRILEAEPGSTPNRSSFLSRLTAAI